MTLPFNRIHKSFKLNGNYYTHEDLKELAYSFIKEGETYEKEIGNFLIDWLSEKDFLFVKSSGSTGKPKIIEIFKQSMVNSALATGDFFNLKPGNKALLCLPCSYIAGKMMLVRAMVLGLEIDCVQPASQPVFDTNKHYHFSAMVPLQVQNTINNLQNIDKIIIGGSQVSAILKNKIKNNPSKFYETYGMTETLTHIAVKPLQSKNNKGQDCFKALKNVFFEQDEKQCLIINAPDLASEKLITNDIVDLKSETEFKWLGRYDNVINSGGVKLFPEQIESKLQSYVKSRFFVAGEEDSVLGEKLILIVENLTESPEAILANIKKNKDLGRFEIPKHVFTVEKFVETSSGKIQRKKTIAKALH